MMTDNPPIPMLVTWSGAVASHVDGASCRHCGTGFAVGDTVYLALDRRDMLVVPYCSREHFDAGPGDGTG